MVVENQHPPIVSHEEYEAANATLRKVKYAGFKASDRWDRVYYCGHCGRRLRKTYGLDEYYSCATKLYRPDSLCTQIYWSRTDMERVVLEAYKAQLVLMNDAYKKIQAEKKEDPVAICRSRQKSILSELETCNAQNMQLYEQYREGIFDKDTFLKQKAVNLQRKDQLQGRLRELQSEEDEAVKRKNELDMQEQSLKESQALIAVPDEELRTVMYDAIEKVVVYGNKEIDIQWKFNIPFQAV